MEDLDLSRRLAATGRIHIVRRPAVAVSGRRYVAHPWSTAAMMNTFPVLARAGVPLRWLARVYGRPR